MTADLLAGMLLPAGLVALACWAAHRKAPPADEGGLDDVLRPVDVYPVVEWTETDHVNAWEAEYDDWADGLTDVADAVWPDGDNRAGGPL